MDYCRTFTRLWTDDSLKLLRFILRYTSPPLLPALLRVPLTELRLKPYVRVHRALTTVLTHSVYRIISVLSPTRDADDRGLRCGNATGCNVGKIGTRQYTLGIR
jgi:hypothetical protein